MVWVPLKCLHWLDKCESNNFNYSLFKVYFCLINVVLEQAKIQKSRRTGLRVG